MNTENRDRKRAWKEQERQKAKSAFPLPCELLESLFARVEAQVDQQGCDHAYRFTEQWLAEHQQPHMPVIAWLEEHGGFCDCEVVANAQGHWEENR